MKKLLLITFSAMFVSPVSAGDFDDTALIAGHAAPAISIPESATYQKKFDFERFRKNCSASLQRQFADHENISLYLAQQQQNGSWQDIDYTSQNLSGWYPGRHLERLRFMAAAWSDHRSPFYHSQDLGNGIKRGLEFWFSEKRRARNWWWNEIYIPMALGHIFILADDLLHDDAWLNNAMPYFDQAQFGRTGQNRIWLAKGVLFKGILTGNPQLVNAARKEIIAEIVYGKVEGIRADGSFHQHGPQPQFGNYGLSYLDSITNLVGYFAGTMWALEDIAPLRDFVINGMRWVLWKDVMDISAQGRQIWKDSQTEKKHIISRSIALLAEKDPAFAEKYQTAPQGNKMFFTADYMVHRTNNFYASFKANSLHTVPVEIHINKDNQLGRYLSDGVLLVMRSGREYLNIAGCWQWNRLPGTTLPLTPLIEPGDHSPPKVAKITPSRRKGTSRFTGGVSDGGKYGVMVHAMDLDKVQAKKAVFFAGNIIIALGSGIESRSPYPVATTVEQSLLCGKVVTGENFFYHNNIGYSGKNIVLSTGKRSGDWQPLWGGYKTSQPDEKEIFQLSIEHGTGVRNGSYEYAVYPDVALKDMPAAMKSFRVVANNNVVQAVKLSNNTIMAVFHKKGSLENFSTDSAGVFIIRDQKIYAADPTQKKSEFNLSLNGVRYRVKLPSGDVAGSTAVVNAK